MKKQTSIPKSKAKKILENYTRYRIIKLEEKGLIFEPVTLPFDFALFHEAEAKAMEMQKEDNCDYGVARQDVIDVLLYIEKGA